MFRYIYLYDFLYIKIHIIYEYENLGYSHQTE